MAEKLDLLKIAQEEQTGDLFKLLDQTFKRSKVQPRGISDAIIWATGSLSPGELRAEKPDDVLFAGSAERKAVDFCEVELVFDNEDGAWPDLPFSEVSVARDRKSTRLNSSHSKQSRMPSSA